MHAPSAPTSSRQGCVAHAKVTADQSMSLDGCTAGPRAGVGQPLGDGGERLHEWMFPNGGAGGINAEVRNELFKASGALVMGRRMFDVGEAAWGNPPPCRVPVFVVTHRPRQVLVERGGTTYTFVAEGIHSALAQARAAAGGKDVAVVGGANTIQQFIEAGLLDELRIHLVPVLLGDGTRLFDHVSASSIELAKTRAIHCPWVTHLTFRVVR